MSEVKVNKISPRSGTDVQLGDSGDTITVPTGATLDTSNSSVTLPDNSVTTAKISDNSVTTAKINNEAVTPAKLGYNFNQFRNIIINGDMSIAQRGTTATGIGNGDSGYHTVDRWKFFENGASTAEFTQSQSTDVPSGQGFATSLKMDCTTADASLGASDGFRISQQFEGQNLQYLKYGTANAESTTVSFWVKSNKTGDYNVSLYNQDQNRIIGTTYTINSADTWEKKTATFAGDTTGTFGNDNGSSLWLWFGLGTGADFTGGDSSSWSSLSNNEILTGQTVNLADNTANDWYITGVQLEAGTTASDFEFLPFDVNLDRCERYYQIISKDDNNNICNAASFGTTNAYGVFNFKKEMRAVPSLDQTTGTSYYQYTNAGAGDNFDSFSLGLGTTRNCRLTNADTIAVSSGQAGWFSNNNASSFVAFDAEL